MNAAMKKKLYVAGVRAGRTFGQALAGYFLWKWAPGMIEEPRISLLFTIIRDKWDPALGVALSVSLTSFGWNFKKPVSVESK